MGMKFTNNASTTLASGISAVATSLTVQTGAGALFPVLGAGDYFYCTLSNTVGNVEIIKVTARTGDVFNTIVRAQDNTTALVWNAGDRVELRLVSASLNDFPKLDENNTFTGVNTFSGTTVANLGNTPLGLTNLLYPNDIRAPFKSGWRPAFFTSNQGGWPMAFRQLDAATDTMQEFWAATGQIQDDGAVNIANAASNTQVSTGFKVGQTANYPDLWLKLAKVGNPGNNLTCFIYSDNGSGSPNALITSGTATAQSGKLHTSDANGAMYRFVFSTPPSLTAGTQYHIVMGSSGAVDASNYWQVKYTANRKYAHGFLNTWNGATWTQTTTAAGCFLIEYPAANAPMQTGGIFGNKKLVFAPGTPLNQSSMWYGKLTDLGVDPNLGVSGRGSGSTFAKGTTICDFLYGQDHDRFVITTDGTSGAATLTVYDSTGLKGTVAGAIDLSTGSHDWGFNVGPAGASLWVDGASQGTPLVTALTFSQEFALLGTGWLGGGFAVAPTWTQKLNMSVLPSADTPAWAWTGTGTEANCMSVANGRLFQNKDGYAATDTGYYLKATAGFVNANGGSLASKVRVSSGTNTKDSPIVSMVLYDGTRAHNAILQELFSEFATATTPKFYPQTDCKISENVFMVSGKGNDTFVFANGRLVADGTASNTDATASNQVLFGDTTATSGENADAVYDYVAYYNTAAILPAATTGQLSEFALFQGDRTGIFAGLWNSGSPISARQFCGVGQDWVREVPMVETRRGITLGPSTTSTTPVLLAEMECYVCGETIDVFTADSQANSVAATATVTQHTIDGEYQRNLSYVNAPGNNYTSAMSISNKAMKPFGLHKVETRFNAGGNTSASYTTVRVMKVESK